LFSQKHIHNTETTFSTAIMTASYPSAFTLVLAHNDDESRTMPQTTSFFSKLLDGGAKTTSLDEQSKIVVTFENDTEWPTFPSKELPTPSVVSESDSHVSSPIFRRRSGLDLGKDSDGEEHPFGFKRANPVYDSDDDDEAAFFCPPQKRRRTSTGVQPAVLLSWCDQFDEDEIYGFAFRSSSSPLFHS
jgi:hypothetical protein